MKTENKRKVIIMKIGQDIILGEGIENERRSNTNGNVGLTKLVKLLVETSPNVQFYIGSKVNKEIERDDWAKEVIVLEDLTKEEQDKVSSSNDAVLLVAGLTSYSNEEELSKVFGLITNTLSNNFVVLSDDPRCLDETLSYEKFTRKPDAILTQFEGEINLPTLGITMETTYIPIETVFCYKESQTLRTKKEDLVIVANSSGDKYDRISKVEQALKSSNNPMAKIYGRLTESDKEKLEGFNLIGEVTYNEIQDELQTSSCTYVVPIGKGMVTSKYVEAILNGCIPLFHEDYGLDLIKREIVRRLSWSNFYDNSHKLSMTEFASNLRKIENRLVITETNTLEEATKRFSRDGYVQRRFSKLLYLTLIKLFTNGEYLADRIKVHLFN